MSAIETLEQEHRLISRVVRLLPAVRRNVDAGVVDEQVLSKIADFFSAFTDGCHHAKEEDLLFPMLQQRGVSSKGCPVGTLRLEHQQGRNVVKALNSAVEKYKGGDARAANTISAILKDATELYTDHIWREDYLLFPMSDKVLLGTDRETLVKDFAGVQAKFGSAFQERYEQLVDQLEKELAQASGPHEGVERLSDPAAPTSRSPCECDAMIAHDQD
ncbi:MAG: hemerythrin domain-containing protein [Nitrososphaerales archaeon]